MSKLIFFVDDDKLILNLLEYTINNRQGYEVKTFTSGEECLKNLDANPHLIVLDHIFNSQGNKTMNGLEILKKIRARNKMVPVIILTGKGDDYIASEYMKNGANYYLPKNDYFIDALMQVIDKFIKVPGA